MTKKLLGLLAVMLLVVTIAFTGNNGKSTRTGSFDKVVIVTGDENTIVREGSVTPRLRADLPEPGDSVGYTWYDFPSNACTKSNIFAFETGEVAMIRMASVDAAATTRGSYWAYFDGADWSNNWTRIEGAKKGFCDAALLADGREVCVSHTGNIFSYPPFAGAGSWTSVTDGSVGTTWPQMTTVGDTVMYIATTGGNESAYFCKSVDGGLTWPVVDLQLDFAANDSNPVAAMMASAERYDIAAFHNHVVVAQADDFDPLVDGSMGGRIFLFESNDYGVTWTYRILPTLLPFTEPFPVSDTYEERLSGEIDIFFDNDAVLHCVTATQIRINDGVNNNLYLGSADVSMSNIWHWIDGGTAWTKVAGTDVDAFNSKAGGYNIGSVGAPSCAVAPNGEIVVLYTAITALSDTDALGVNYYDIVAKKSSTNGATWNEHPYLLTPNVGYESVYPSAYEKIMADGTVWFVYQSDAYTGNILQGSQPEQVPSAIKVHHFNKDLISVPTDNEKPNAFTLKQNYPNPFNPNTTIEYDVKGNVNVTLKIYNMLGQEVRSLVNSRQNAGNYKVQWNGNDNAGNAVSSGVYMYRLEAGDVKLTKKMTLLK